MSYMSILMKKKKGEKAMSYVSKVKKKIYIYIYILIENNNIMSYVTEVIKVSQKQKKVK